MQHLLRMIMLMCEFTLIQNTRKHLNVMAIMIIIMTDGKLLLQSLFSRRVCDDIIVPFVSDLRSKRNVAI